jgi:hypothetical protein
VITWHVIQDQKKGLEVAQSYGAAGRLCSAWQTRVCPRLISA